MLRVLFGWLDAHPWVYWAILAGPTSALIALVLASWWPSRAERKGGQFDRLFIAVSLACLWAWRWPFLLESREFNPDESQLIAGAITLTHDPVFWRSVDGTTSGPLNFYALLPLHALGLPLDYFTARLTGLILISVTLIASYRLLRSFAAPAPAQLAMLPLLVFFATTTDPFFLEYSSGDVSIALFAVSAYLLLRHRRPDTTDHRALLVGSVLCGLLPWAKLQSIPLGLALIGGCLWLVIHDKVQPWRHRTRLIGTVLLAAALPTVVGLVLVVSTGQFEAFVQGYLRQNAVYVDHSASLAEAVRGMWRFTSETYAYPAFMAASTLTVAVTLGLCLVLRKRLSHLFVPASACVVAAAVCVLVPRRPYAHYLLLTLVPLTLWSGAALAALWPAIRSRRRLGLALLTLGCLAPLVIRFTQPPPAQFGQFADNWRRPYSLGGTLLRSCSLPGDSLGVWGWRTDLYVDGRMRQATRDPHTFWSLVNTPYQSYYQQRFLADLKHSRPAFFVDTVGNGAVFYQNRREWGHEIVPALAEYVAREYILLADLETERVYLRSDLHSDSRRNFTQARLQQVLAKARVDADPEVEAPPPEAITPATLGIWSIDGRNVRMLLPPAKLAWALDGTEKQATLVFGFHPRAYREGQSNGADVIVELEAAGYPIQTLFQRHLDPARAPGDRDVQIERVPLPNDIAGLQLVIRTGPGEYGDQAWDWVYLAGLRYVRKVDRQFPGFGAEVIDQSAQGDGID
jgi:hypothetical protein